jgi:multiple sugar transport system substrate-binding protein
MVGVSIGAAQTTITYWQYDYATRVDAMNQLIAQFEAANPDIKVVQETFPYDGYPAQVAASIPAGQGPDVAQLFYGWLPTWARGGYVVPLPDQYFDAAELDANFAPLVQAAKVDGTWYGLPTAVRSLALFYNADMLAAAGYDAPPATWDEFVEIAQALTVKEGNRLVQVGYGFAPNGQDHHLVREVLVRQFGGAPYSDDYSTVTYADQAGIDALTFYTDWVTKYGFAVPEFVPGNNGYRDGFRQLENIAMIVDGSFAIGDVQKVTFNWGVTELPVRAENGVQSNFGSFFMNALTPNATKDPAKLEAASRFLKFVTSDDAMKLWLSVVGELPASRSLIADPALAADPVYGPFVRALDYAHATVFVDETGQRDTMVDAINEVVLQGTSPADALKAAAAEEQLLLDANR